MAKHTSIGYYRLLSSRTCTRTRLCQQRIMYTLPEVSTRHKPTGTCATNTLQPLPERHYVTTIRRRVIVTKSKFREFFFRAFRGFLLFPLYFRTDDELRANPTGRQWPSSDKTPFAQKLPFILARGPFLRENVKTVFRLRSRVDQSFLSGLRIQNIEGHPV